MAIYPTYAAFRSAVGTPGIANDGFPPWPISRLVSVSTIVTVSNPFTFTFPYGGGVNGAPFDTVPGVDEYNWYLSQGTDDVSKQYMSLSQQLNRSSAFVVNITPLGSATFPTLSVEELTRLFFQVYVYSRRISNGAIDYVDMTKALFSQI